MSLQDWEKLKKRPKIEKISPRALHVVSASTTVGAHHLQIYNHTSTFMYPVPRLRLVYRYQLTHKFRIKKKFLTEVV